MIDPALTILSASNAEDGLALLEEQTPDLVFLDIRMPGMNGLDMLEQIRRRFGDVCVVILSAYDHFPYAQQAIRLGVFDYIVKPYSVDVIRRIVEYVAAQGPRKAMSIAAQNIHLSSMLVRWLQEPEKYAASLAEQLRIDASDCRGALILFTPIVSSEEQRQFYAHARTSLLADVRRVMENWFAAYGVCLTFASGGEIISALVYAREEAPLPAEKIAAFLGGVTQNILLQTGIALSAAIGEAAPNLLTGAQRMYVLLRALSEYAFYTPRLAPIYRDLLVIDVHRAIGPASLQAVGDAIREGNPPGARDAVKALFDHIAGTPWMPPQRLIYTLHSYMTDLLARMSGSMPVSALDAFQDQVQEISEYPDSIDAFAGRVSCLCSELADVVKAFQINKNVSIMTRCIDFLEENYGDNSLAQETVAQKYHFSPSYFGTLFKATTGYTFVQYLNKLRIDKAREMLESSNKKIYAVAERVGFSDVRYFIRVFKKMTGVSPNQYRAMMSPKE